MRSRVLARRVAWQVWSTGRDEVRHTPYNKVLPAPLTSFAPTYMARCVCGARTEWRVLSGSRFVSPQMEGHVGNTRTLGDIA